MKFKLSAFLVALSCGGAAQAALTAGDIAIIGRINDGSPDTFAFVVLSDIAAGETVYFTDNGWTGSAYRGTTSTDGDGNENLAKWVTTSAVSAGTIIYSSALTTSGSISGSSSSFGAIALGQSGDQINVFQNSSASNPLYNTATQTTIYAFDDTNGFEAATDSSTGAAPTGVSVAANTAVSINAKTGGTARIKASVLASVGYDKAAWLAAFADASNWETGSSTSLALPTGSLSVAAAVPEPATLAFAMTGLLLSGLVARRRKG
jgi:hypothetical protein